MSTDLTQTARTSARQNIKESPAFTFDNLVDILAKLERAPTLQEINNWVLDVTVTSDDIRPFLGFKAGNYSRHRVVLSDFAELLVLCWRPGQRTPIHDHNGSFGAVRVCEGIMWETIFTRNNELKLCYKTAREWHQMDVTAADVPDIHQIGNPDVSGVDLVTLHLYAPPLGVLNTYRVGSSEVGHYSVDEFMDGAGI